MSQDALATLLRVRRNALDDAQRVVSDALRKQHILQTQSEAEAGRFADETLAAVSLSDGDEAVDAFARWLPIGRKALERARVAEEEASGELDRSRVVLGLARAAYRSVELLIEKRADEARQVRDRKEQYVMDELARRPGSR